MLLLLVGASSGALLPKAGAWMEGIKHFFGVLLLATAWWMVNSVVPAWLAVLGWAALALWSAVMLHAFEPLAPKAGQAGIVRQAIGLLLALWAALMIVGVAAGGRDVWQPLKAMWPVQGQAGVQPRQAWQSPLSGGGAALSGLLAANGAQGGLSEIGRAHV